MAPEWSSSTTHGTASRRRPSTFASASARVRVMETPVGLWARGWRTTATGRDSNASFNESGRMPSASSADRDDLGPQRLDEVEERREAGVLEHHPVAVADDLLEHPPDAVDRAVDDGQRLDGVGPGGDEVLAEVGQDRLVVVGQRARPGRDAGQRRPQRREQLGVGHAAGEIEADTVDRGGLGPDQALHAGRQPGGRGVADEGAGPAAGVDEAGTAQRLPGGGDRGGGDAELGGDVADRGEPLAGGELAGADRPAEGAGDAPGRPVVKQREVHCHGEFLDTGEMRAKCSAWKITNTSTTGEGHVDHREGRHQPDHLDRRQGVDARPPRAVLP